MVQIEDEGALAKGEGEVRILVFRSPLFPSDFIRSMLNLVIFFLGGDRVSALSPKGGATTRNNSEKEGDSRTRRSDVALDSEGGSGLTEREIRLQRRHYLSSNETSPDLTGDLRSSRKRLRRTIENDDDSDEGSIFDDEDLEERRKESTKSEGRSKPLSVISVN